MRVMTSRRFTFSLERRIVSMVTPVTSRYVGEARFKPSQQTHEAPPMPLRVDAESGPLIRACSQRRSASERAPKTFINELPFGMSPVTPFVNSAYEADIDRLVRKYRRGMVNSLLEYLILNCLESGEMCGYEIISLLHERFHTLLSPGQVYPVIDHLESLGLIRKEKRGRTVMLSESRLGKSLLKAWREEFTMIQMQLNNLGAREVRAVA